MMNFDCKVETTSKIGRSLLISVNPESIQQFIDSRLESLKKKAKIKGFRPGKAPMSIIKKEYLGEVKSDALSSLIQESYIQAIQNEKIDAIGNPNIEPQSGMDLKEGEPLVYKASVEIYPKIEVSDISKIEVEQVPSDVTDEDVTKYMDELRQMHAEVITDETNTGPVKNDDQVLLSFKGTIDGKTRDELNGENRLVKVGSGSFLKDFEDALIGMKKGEEKTFPAVLPTEIPDKDLAGKTVEFTVTIHEFKKQKLPELNDEFAKILQAETLLELKKKVFDSLVEQKKRVAADAMESQVIEALIKGNTFDVPDHFIRMQLESLVRDASQRMKQQGMTEKMMIEYLQSSEKNLKEQAEKQVRSTLILNKIAEDQAIKIEEADLEHHYAKLASHDNMNAQDVRKMFIERKMESDLRFQLKVKRTLEYILGTVKLVPKKQKKTSKK